MSETPILNRTNVKFKEIGILFAIYSSKRKEDRAKGKDGVSHRLIPSHNLHFSHSRGNIKMLNWNVEEKKRGVEGGKGLEERRNSYYSCTLPGGALELGEVCAPHLRHRLTAPGRLTAMCHDRRTNAGNLQFSFALIDHTVAGKAFHVKLSKIAFQTGGEGSYFYLLPVIPFSTLAHHLRFISRTRVIISTSLVRSEDSLIEHCRPSTDFEIRLNP